MGLVPQTCHGNFIIFLQFSGKHRWSGLCSHIPHMLVWRREKKLTTEKEAKISKTVVFCEWDYQRYSAAAQRP